MTLSGNDDEKVRAEAASAAVSSVEPESVTAVCGPDCDCGQPSGSTRTKVAVSLIVLLAIGGILAPLTFVTAIWFTLNPQDVDQLNTGEAMGFIIVGMVIAVGLYGGIVAAIYKTMVRDFDMIVRKQSK